MINKDKEVGGTHYSDMKIEPIELIEAFNLNFIQGNIVKYVSRYKSKGGTQDLEKAMHYCDIGVKGFDRVDNYIDCKGKNKLLVRMYCVLNSLGNTEENAIGYAISNDYEKCRLEITNLIGTMEVGND